MKKKNVANKISNTKKTITYRNEYVTIESADKVKFEYRIANPLLRLGAWVIDFIILILIFLLILDVFGWLDTATQQEGLFDPEYSSAVLYAMVMIVFFLLRWFYYTAFELLLEGRTPGKIICRIRTIHYQGKFLSFSSIVLRNFARIVDQELTFFLGAAIAMLINKEYRRLGDLLGNTVVVRDEKVKTLDRTFTFKLHEMIVVPATAQATPLGRLSEEDLFVLKTFLNSHKTIPEPRRWELLCKMAETIKQKIADGGTYSDPLAYLTSVYRWHTDGV